METTKVKKLFFDIEVSRDIVGGYGSKWDFKVVKTIRHQELMCFAYKWEGDKNITYVSRNHDGGYDGLVDKLWNLLNEADIVVAHNGNKFDNKMANRFFIKEGRGPVSPYKSVDTLQVARREFKFQSNSLNDLCEYLDIGSKRKITYADIEDDFLNNPTPKIERLMELYNRQDIVLLEKLYNKFLPFIRNHPNVGDILQINGICPKCGSDKLEKRGFNMRRNGKVQRYQCRKCGCWTNESKLKGEGRLVNA